MKKFSNVAALIAAGALLFGGLFFSCSSDGLPPEIGFESKIKTIENGSAATLNVTGTSASSSDEKVAKAEIDGTDIKITSVWVGKATITVTDGTDDVTIPVYVKSSGDIELGTATKASASNNGGSGNPTTYAWTFADLDLTKTTWISNGASSGVDTDASDGSVAKVTPETDLSYASTPSGMALTIGGGSSSGSYNKISNSQAAKGDGSVGSIEPSKGDMVTASVTGPFTATMVFGSNAASDKTDRTADIYINGTSVKSATTVPSTPTTMTYEYTGTDTVTVGFGGSNIVRIHDVKITK